MELQNKQLTERIIAAAGLMFERQKLLPVFYREHLMGEHRLDFLIEQKVILELKAISALEHIHFAIVRSYFEGGESRRCAVAEFRNDAADCKACRPRILACHQRRKSCPLIFLVSWIPDS